MVKSLGYGLFGVRFFLFCSNSVAFSLYFPAKRKLTYVKYMLKMGWLYAEKNGKHGIL